MRIRFIIETPKPKRALRWDEYEDLPYIGPPIEAIGALNDDFVEDDPYAGIDWGDH